MKIGILTQPLHNNYGGILQAFALQTTLQRLGHEPWILQREFNYNELRFWWHYNAGNVARALLGKPLPPFTWEKYKHPESPFTHAFINEHINPRTPYLLTTRSLREECSRLALDAYVVGSDQVWRPMYSPRIEDYFLGFLAPDDDALRIAYSASFGTDDWEYSLGQAARCAALLQRFSAVSVRERGGISLCGRLGRKDAIQTLDPTLLLSPADYEALAAGAAPSPGRLFCYVLDRSASKKELIRNTSAQTGLPAFEVMPAIAAERRKKSPDIVYPSPAQWLRAFMDAEAVITDSFHGTVFSILFHRPFVALGNTARGQARFTSLLALFGLEHRLLPATTSAQQISAALREPVDWDSTDRRLNQMREVSIQFLTKSLKR